MTPSPLLTTVGAVAADGVDSGVAAHYGDPLREQKIFTGGLGVIDRSNRGVVTIQGPDRLSWLQSLTTQDVESLGPGAGTQALVLDPHGRVEHHLTLVDDGTTTWIHVEPERARQLTAWLESMRFMLRVEVADSTAQFAVITTTPNAQTGEGPFVRTDLGLDLFVDRAALASRISQHGDLVGLSAYEAARIAELQPRFGFDTDERSIPNESRWLTTAVHLSKGCYRGQETVARVSNLGQPPRRTLLVQLDGGADRLPNHGAEVVVEGRAIGRVGSVARHFEMGPIALALVKRPAVDSAFEARGQVVVEVDGVGGILERDPLQVPASRAPRPDLLRLGVKP